MKTAIPAIFLIAISQIAGPAFASDLSVEHAKHIVNYADLDLTRPAGAATLYARIAAAAREVCEPAMTEALASIILVRRCTAETVTRAVADVSEPVLTAYHLARSRS